MENTSTFIEIGTQPTKVDAMAIQHTNPSLLIQCHIMNLGSTRIETCCTSPPPKNLIKTNINKTLFL
jgi:hypothetical protein